MSGTNNELILSGSINGKLIKVAATSSPGTLIHTAVAGTTTFDNIYLYCHNNHTADVQLTIEWGGSTTDDQLIVGIPFREGKVLTIPGLPLQNSLIIRAFASVTNVVFISGLVNQRIN
jgi:hypothetical protein